MVALLPGLVALLLAASASSVQASSPSRAASPLSNRALYTPRKRLTADVPGVNPNVTYLNPYSKPHTTGLIDDVAWDRYSLYVKGQRLFIYSGEFHPWRLPVVDLWRDILQKAKASGNNAISIYVPWHMTNPSEGVLDMSGIRDLQPFFDMAKEIGIWIMARPGPFANAETSGGGIPGWVIRKGADMRTNDADYFASWQVYWDAICKLVAKNQISQGGPVITFQLENEFDTGVKYSPHMEELKESARRNGITVPLTHNNPRGRGHWSFGQGAVDIAAVDAYPAGFSCKKGNSSFPALVDAFVGWSERVNREAPYHFAEIQGGSFDPWGGDGGYDMCREMTGPAFDRVQYRYLLEARVTMINKYMWYGGTNWGGIAAPVVYTSYDYGTYVQESRQLPDKYMEHKLLGLFLRNAPDIRQAEVVGYFGEFSEYSLKRQPYVGRPAQNGTFYTPQDGGLWTTELRNPDTLGAFYIVRQAKWATNITAEFTRQSTLDIWTPETGDLNVPQYGSQIVIGGRDSRIIPTDLTFGSTTVRYSTAEVLLSAALDEEREILILYGTPGRNETFEVVFAGLGSAQVQGGERGSTNATTWDVDGDLVMTFQIPSAPTHASLLVGSTTVLILDHTSAYKVWQPTLATDDGEWSAYAEVGTNSSAVVLGPHLVRNGSVEDGSRLALFGDTVEETETTIFAPSSISRVTWNGADVPFNVTDFGMLATLPGPDVSNASAPTFSDWAWADSLPEAAIDFDDSNWGIVADHTSTNATTLPLNGQVALVATDYGFVTGTILWRGSFNGTTDATGLYVNVTGGTGFAFSAYLNGVFLGFNESVHGLTDTAFKSMQVDFPTGALSSNGTNVILIIQDHMGLDQDTELDKKSKNLRGISEVRLLGSTSTPPLSFTQWKVQGNRGGEVGFPDRVRGIFNEGGFYGEREGWHLPGFDDSAWNTSMAAPALDGPGVRFFRSKLDLVIPDGHDAGMSFDFGSLGGHHRVYLYVNGWQMGRMAASVGPQLVFPVHTGILVSGENTIALAVWSYDEANATSIDLSFKVDWLVRGGVGPIRADNPGWEARN